MKLSFEIMTSLQYKVKALTRELACFKTGEKYETMVKEHKKKVGFLESIIKNLREEVATLRKDIIRNRNQWFVVFEDMEKEHKKEIKYWIKTYQDMEKRALKSERKLDEAKDKIVQQRHELYNVGTQLEDALGKILKLTAQLHHDFQNSSIPSSKSTSHKKIENSREKTNKKPGAQVGHKGHGRKKQTPTQEPILLPPPEEVLNDAGFKKTKKTITKQVVGIRILLDVKEYQADVYYNSQTGERLHAKFPDGVVNEVNYDGSVKAFLFLLNNDCHTSIDKSSKFLSDLTGGKLQISKGMISQLTKEFASKSETELDKIFGEILCSPVMHTDNTNAKVNGEQAYVFVSVTPEGKLLYFAREKKGHKGVESTPVEDYQGILVHDHDKTFYHYGSDHQECLAHVLRYLKDSMQNESERTWHKQMYDLLREMIHCRKTLDTDTTLDEVTITAYERKYCQILDIAKNEYEDEPPSAYYRDGYNLYKRLEKYMANHLLFLHNKQVPTTNNEAERQLRQFKRKQQQAVTFRSQDSLDYLCQSMSMLFSMRQKEVNLFEEVSQVFG